MTRYIETPECPRLSNQLKLTNKGQLYMHNIYFYCVDFLLTYLNY